MADSKPLTDGKVAGVLFDKPAAGAPCHSRGDDFMRHEPGSKLEDARQ
jgi:hypothetical protein